MAKQINVDVQSRKPGKKHARVTREQKLIPVVIYGKGKDSEFGAIEDMSFRKNVLAHENALFSLNYNGKSVSAVVRNLDIDYMNNKVIHADFYAVNMDQKIDATVTIKFIGEPIGVREGGVMNKALEELQVFCLPSDIPDNIEVDVSHLDIDDRILISDMTIPANVEVLHDADQTVVAIAIKAEEPEEVVEVVAAAEGVVAGASGAEATAEKAAGDATKDKKDDKAS
jgi:large subunit ribosomal protein L25